MYTKSFVSLYFTSRTLSIVQLSGNKLKVVKSATVPIPEGIFTRTHIVDVDTFGTFLKGIWEKLGIREKSVGIVVPESATFTKLITIPKVSASELDESVSWQVQDVFPVDPEKLIIDWKLVEKRDAEYDILVVAVYKEVLQSIVSASEHAGLMPVIILSPSISMTTFIDPVHPTLTIYKDSESVISLSKNKSVYGSSILLDPTDTTIVKVAEQIANHYKDVSLKTIVLAGKEVNEGLITKLKETLKIADVHLFEKSVGGLNKEQTQEYLVPLSLQYAPISEPSDMSTINLLPSHLVQHYRYKKARVQVWSLGLTSTLFIWTLVSLVVASFFYLHQQTVSLAESTKKQANVTQQRKKVASDVLAINTVASQVLQISDITLRPEVVLNEIFQATPVGIQIERYTLDLDKGEVVLKGTATDRQALITLKQNLEKSDHVDTVDIPISSFETETNVEFQASFDYGAAVPAVTIP